MKKEAFDRSRSVKWGDRVWRPVLATVSPKLGRPFLGLPWGTPGVPHFGVPLGYPKLGGEAWGGLRTGLEAVFGVPLETQNRMQKRGIFRGEPFLAKKGLFGVPLGYPKMGYPRGVPPLPSCWVGVVWGGVPHPKGG